MYVLWCLYKIYSSGQQKRLQPEISSFFHVIQFYFTPYNLCFLDYMVELFWTFKLSKLIFVEFSAGSETIQFQKFGELFIEFKMVVEVKNSLFPCLKFVLNLGIRNLPLVIGHSLFPCIVVVGYSVFPWWHDARFTG